MSNVPFEAPHSHTHDHNDSNHSHSHSHNGGDQHGHTHEIMDGPGNFITRDMPNYHGRDWKERGFTIGIGGSLSSFPSFLKWC